MKNDTHKHEKPMTKVWKTGKNIK